jgi:hypothetical protein
MWIHIYINELFVNNQEHFQTQQYTVLTLGIRTIFIDQLPTFIFKEVHIMMASKSSTVYHQIWEVLWMKRHNLK